MNKSTIPQIKKYGYVKNNSTVAGIQIVESLDSIINSSEKQKKTVYLIWFHKMGNQFSASNFAVPLLKIANKYRKCEQYFQIVKYICSAKNFHEEAIRPQFIPSIAIYDTLTGKSTEIYGKTKQMSGSNLFKIVLDNIYEFMQVHQFHEA